MASEWSRRRFLRSSASVATGFWALRNSFQQGALADTTVEATAAYGPLVQDPEGILDLPEGFTYRVIARGGEPMADGYITPGKPDGMATFAGPNGQTVLVINHELTPVQGPGPFGTDDSLLKSEHKELLYDAGPCAHRGGTTTLVYDTTTQSTIRHYLSLAGTNRNCAGGATPWNTWITCEETVDLEGEVFDYNSGERYVCGTNHGYNFEVPALADIKLHSAIPLKEMGRFNHEAIAVDPRSGIVYQTEDRDNGLIYRYVPNTPGELAKGGKLQALMVADCKSADTRNWRRQRFDVGEAHTLKWIDLEDIDAPEDDLRKRGFQAGAAKFARGEGMWFSEGQIFFACTNGGCKKTGQIWRLVPGTDGTPDQLELFIEPNDSALLESADNLTVAPWGDLFVCEDRDGDVVRVVGVTMQGSLYTFAANHMNTEFAGVTFSLDGSTMFVNLQHRDLTVAITGPWQGRMG